MIQSHFCGSSWAFIRLLNLSNIDAMGGLLDRVTLIHSAASGIGIRLIMVLTGLGLGRA
jgi:hypothetical protein